MEEGRPSLISFIYVVCLRQKSSNENNYALTTMITAAIKDVMAKITIRQQLQMSNRVIC